MQKKSLINYLENSTKDVLINKMRIAGLKYSGLAKSAIVVKLEAFFQDEQTIEKIWNSLSPFERDLCSGSYPNTMGNDSDNCEPR